MQYLAASVFDTLHSSALLSARLHSSSSATPKLLYSAVIPPVLMPNAVGALMSIPVVRV
jgi:hypothetical protein